VLESWALGVGSVEGPVTVDDVLTSPDLSRLASDAEIPFGSICAAPLVFRGRHLGLLVALATQSRTFLPRDVDLIQSTPPRRRSPSPTRDVPGARGAREPRPPHRLLNLREFHESLTRELERCKRYGGRFSVALLRPQPLQRS